MITFRIFENTPLRFSNDQNIIKPQTERNRLRRNYTYSNKLPASYSLEFDKSDPLFFQYRTECEDVTIKMRHSSGAIVVGNTSTSLIKIYDDETNRKQYRVDFDLSGLNGCYEILIEAKQLNLEYTWTSEPIYICDSELPYIEWFGSDSLNDPFIWGDTRARIRVKSMLKDKANESDKTTFTDTDGNEVTTYALPINARVLKVRLVPEWVLDTLNLAIQHDEFYINNRQFSAKGLFEFDDTKGDMYPLKITVTQNNYWNFTTDETFDGRLIPPGADEFLLINDTDYLLINDTDYLKINN